ncbi:MAG: hypothetical protein K9G44_04540 [Melioribacteraceae bacterium]|nr:hypothetical protein [Melioribacteraceae bacterium]
MKDKKLLNTFILFGLFVVINVAGFYYTEMYQSDEITSAKEKFAKLIAERIEPEYIYETLADLKERSKSLDELLKKEDHLIPQNLSQSSLFTYVDNLSQTYSKYSHCDMVFRGIETESEFEIQKYELSGVARFKDFYKLILNIESGVEFKRIEDLSISDILQLSDDDYPMQLVKFSMLVSVYSSQSNKFMTVDGVNQNFLNKDIYNIFFPLIRNEVPPNKDNLLDVANAKLLALIPEGAYISDSKGGSYLLKEGEAVYLGYLVKINFVTEEVQFVINRGGLVEKITLTLESDEGVKK